MATNFLIEPTDLDEFIENSSNTLLIDIGTTESYMKHHIPGAVYFDFKHLISGIAPSPGTLPDSSKLGSALAQSGINQHKPIVAYDDEGGGKASRLLWTLDLLGFKHLHLINGGLHAWAHAGQAMETQLNTAEAVEEQILEFDNNKFATKSFLLENLDNPQIVIWDVRTQEEYLGTKPRAARNGHIPGAVHLNWLDTIDRNNALRYKPKDELIDLLNGNGITTDKTIIPHCQTHHRSAHSSMLLKYLGYENIKAYPGSWSEWGNAADTPIEN